MSSFLEANNGDGVQLGMLQDGVAPVLGKLRAIDGEDVDQLRWLGGGLRTRLSELVALAIPTGCCEVLADVASSEQGVAELNAGVRDATSPR